MFLSTLQLTFAEETEDENKRISCSLTQSKGNHYSVTCQDFSESSTNKVIDCCTLLTGHEYLITWGSNCIDTGKINGEQIQQIEAKEPTATYCSVKFRLQEVFQNSQTQTEGDDSVFRALC